MMNARSAILTGIAIALLLGGLFYYREQNGIQSTENKAKSGNANMPTPTTATTPRGTSLATNFDELRTSEPENRPSETQELDFILKKYQDESVKFTYLEDGHIQFEEGAEIKIDNSRTISSESGLFYSTPDLRCLYGDLTIHDDASGSDYTFRAVLIDSNGDFLMVVDDAIPIFDLYRKLLENPSLKAREVSNFEE